MGRQKHFLNNDAGIGLVEAMVTMALVAIAAAGIFSVLEYANQQNIATVISWNSVQSAMAAWTQTPVAANTQQSVAVTVSGATGQGTEDVPVAETASGSASYGWWRSAP